MRWSEADLRARRKGEPGKVQLARELRSKTTCSSGSAPWPTQAWLILRARRRLLAPLGKPVTQEDQAGRDDSKTTDHDVTGTALVQFAAGSGKVSFDQRARLWFLGIWLRANMNLKKAFAFFRQHGH